MQWLNEMGEYRTTTSSNMLPQSCAACIYAGTGYSPPPLSLRGHSRSASAQIIDLPLTEEKYTRRPVLSGRHTFTPKYTPHNRPS